MIRRTGETKDHNGEHINATLPLKTSIIMQYHVTDKEMEAAGHALLEDTITMYENLTQVGLLVARQRNTQANYKHRHFMAAHALTLPSTMVTDSEGGPSGLF